jgi:hypothetical protein
VKPQQHQATSPPAQPDASPGTVPAGANWGDNPVYVRSQQAFYRNLPELLKRHEGKWAAYHGDECVGIARTETELWERCTRSGLKPGEFVVLYVFTGALQDNDEACWVVTDADGKTFYRE